MLISYTCPKHLVILFSFSVPVILPGFLENSLWCVISFIFYLLQKHFGVLRVKLGEENKLVQKEVSHTECSSVLHALLLAQDHVPQQPPQSACEVRRCFKAHFPFFCADQSLCYHEEQRLHIKQKLHQLEVLYLHKMGRLYFLIPSTGVLHSQVSADVTIVVFKCMISYLVSSCLPLIMFAWWPGIVKKALWLEKSQKICTEQSWLTWISFGLLEKLSFWNLVLF